MVVSVLVVSNKDSVPDVIDSDTAEDHVRVVKFVVVAHPWSDESPESLDLWVGTESGLLLNLSSYNI